MTRIFASFLILFLLPLSVLAQQADEQAEFSRFGLAASLQGNQLDILVPINVDARMAFVPSVGFSANQDIGTDLRFGLAMRHYVNDNRVRPYVGGRAAILFFLPSEPEFGPRPDNMLDWLAGVFFGGEAFITPFLSVGVEAQLNAAFSSEMSSRFGNPDRFVINTGAAAMVTVYF